MNKKCTVSIQIFINSLFKREYCRFYFRVHGDKVFNEFGMIHRSAANKWAIKFDIIKRWRDGMTGMPYVDACMRELNATGFLPDRGRKLVANYLTLDLK